MLTEKERIEKIILDEGLTSGQFAVEIGIQNSTLSHILNNRNNPSLDVIKKILNRFPNISSDWLISGKGSIYREIKQSQGHTLFDSIGSNDLKSDDYSRKMPANSNMSIEFAETKKSKNSELNLPPGEQTSEIHQKVEKAQETILDQQSIRISAEKKVQKIIIYYTDHTFQEFESK